MKMKCEKIQSVKQNAGQSMVLTLYAEGGISHGVDTQRRRRPDKSAECGVRDEDTEIQATSGAVKEHMNIMN